MGEISQGIHGLPWPTVGVNSKEGKGDKFLIYLHVFKTYILINIFKTSYKEQIICIVVVVI